MFLFKHKSGLFFTKEAVYQAIKSDSNLYRFADFKVVRVEDAINKVKSVLSVITREDVDPTFLKNSAKVFQGNSDEQ